MEALNFLRWVWDDLSLHAKQGWMFFGMVISSPILAYILGANAQWIAITILIVSMTGFMSICVYNVFRTRWNKYVIHKEREAQRVFDTIKRTPRQR